MLQARVLLLSAFTAGATLVHAQSTPANLRWAAWEDALKLQENSSITGIPWRSIGPSVQGGRVVDIETVPGRAQEFYVAYASGGVWKTTNNGQSFTPLSDQLPNMISGDVAVDPNNPETIWIGTGEPNASRSSYSGLGIFKSIDGGKTFASSGLLGADRISRIVVDPKNSQRILVAVQGALYTEGGLRGVYLSEDGGKSWKQTLQTINGWTGATELVLHPTKSKIVYAATWDKARSPWNFRESGVGSAIYKSTDGGKTFARLKSFPSGAHIGRIGLAVSKAKPDWLYVSLDNLAETPAQDIELGDSPFSAPRLKTMSRAEFLRQDPQQIEAFLQGSDLPLELDAQTLIEKVKSNAISMDQLRAKLEDGNSALFNTDIIGLEIYRSEDGGSSFSKRNHKPIREVTYSYGYYFALISASPTNADHLVMAGVPLIESKDGGKSFTGTINQREVHVDHHAYVFDSNFPKRIFNGNDGGIDVSYDEGKHWDRLDRQALGQAYTVQFDMATPYNVYTGLQDNGTLKGSSLSRSDDLRAWQVVGGGDGMQIEVDDKSNALITGYQFGNYRSSLGFSVRPIAPFDQPNYRFNWQTPIRLSQFDNSVLYMGANKMFRSLDQGKTFEAISGDLTRSKNRGNVPFATITTIAESPKQFGMLWAGTDDSQVWLSDNFGQSWRNVSKGLPDGWIAGIEPSRFARYRSYVAVNRYRHDDQRALIYVTEDSGRNWRSIAANLPDMPVNVIREDPTHENLLYVGTDRGAYASLDRGRNWQAIGSGLPNVPVHDLKIHPRERELIAGTHGRSVWVLDVLPLQELVHVNAATTLKAFHIDSIDFDRSGQSAPNPWFAHWNERKLVALNFYSKSAGNGSIDIKNTEGQVLRTLSFDAKPGLNQVLWDESIDLDSAIAFENALINKRIESGDLKGTERSALNAKETPYAQAKLYGWPNKILAGTYSVIFKLNGATSETKLVVNPAKPIESQKPATPKIRGK
jgi:photosystem II stability/assembly factor-like uncharacterized protein